MLLVHTRRQVNVRVNLADVVKVTVGDVPLRRCAPFFAQIHQFEQHFQYFTILNGNTESCYPPKTGEKNRNRIKR